MDLQKYILRICGLAVAFAILLRLGADGAFQPIAQSLSDPKTAAILLYLETGYFIRPATPSPPTLGEITQIDPVPPETEPAQAVFAPEDAELVRVNRVCSYETDLPALLLQSLNWELAKEAPTVLILHSHGSESYTKTEDYAESSAYRTLDTNYNVVSIGAALAQALEAAGIGVIHDMTLHDQPSYNSSYSNARSAIRAALEENPQICLVLDIHRDSVELSDGSQKPFAIEVAGVSTAQLMLVVGTDAGGLRHPDWPENMSLAVKLHAQLEKRCPGICRPISFRTQRFNQDLSPGALIVEVGSAGNTRQEALAAAEILGQAIIDLSHGAITDSTR